MPRTTIPSRQDRSILQGVIVLVLFVSIDVKEIARLGRLFPWDDHKPASCPRCNSRLWWHGFVFAYFSCLSEGIYLRRLRCPCCGAVHRLRPRGYFRRFRSSISEIKDVITHRCRQIKWRPDLPRGRQRKWWHNLWRLLWLLLGRSYKGCALKGFCLLMKQNIIPVSRAEQKENRIVK